MTEDGSKEVSWAQRVRQMDIRRLYETEAQGRVDEEPSRRGRHSHLCPLREFLHLERRV